MNGDALSDLLLLVVCAGLGWRARRRPAFALAMGLVGLAAFLGVLRFSGVAPALGPHKFFSMIASCAGLPLLGVALAWPDSLSAREREAAVRWAFFASAIGVVTVGLALLPLWGQIAPASAALLVILAAWRQPLPMRVAGAVILTSCFALATTQSVVLPGTNSVQQLHILLALSFLLLGAGEDVQHNEKPRP